MSITSLIQANPKISIIIISLLVSLFITLVNYFVMDKERMRELKDKQKKLSAEIKDHQKAGNHEKAMALQKEMLSHAGETMKHSLKPMLITMIPILIVFSMIRNTFSETSIASTWFWYYLVTSIAASMVFRKVFKLP